MKVKIGDLFNLEKGTLQSTKCSEGKYTFVTAAEEWKTHNEYTHNCEALIFAAAASGSLGRTHYINGKFISSDLCFILTPKKPDKYPIDLKFYHFVFNALKNDIVKKTKSGTSKESINQKNIKKYELPYFDKEQQQLWINKLLHTKDDLNQLSIESAHQQSLLKKLRQSILQDAISGKLTEQWRKGDHQVEPASDLLKRIMAEKDRLVKENKIKRSNPLSPISEKEKPFSLPEDWVWCRLGDLLVSLQYGTSKKCSYDETRNTPILRIPNVSSGYINTQDLKFTDLSNKEKEQYSLQNGDLLVIRSNGSRELVGRSVYVDESYEKFGYAGYLIRLRFLNSMLNIQFIQNYLYSPILRRMIETPLRTTVGINNINSTELSSLITPLPPLKEQKNIVVKVQKLLALCYELETRITTDQLHAEQLMQAVLREAFSHTSGQQCQEATNA